MRIAAAILIFAATAGLVQAGGWISGTDYYIDLYGKLTGRTVLGAPIKLYGKGELPVIPDLQDTNAAIKSIEAIFTSAQYSLVRDGEKFVRLMPLHSDFSNSELDLPLKTVGPAPEADTSKSNETYAAGEISFPAMDLNTFLSFYSRVSGRILLRPPTLPQPVIHLVSQTPWTRAEAVYAFEMTMALNNIAVIHDGDRFAQIVAESELAKVQTNAPAFKTNEARISVAFPGRTTISILTTFYAPNGKKLEISNGIGSTQVFAGLVGEMTRSETTYAIETILRFNGYSIVPLDDTKLTVVKTGGK